MKTRVVKYWHQTEWFLKVEEYLQATGEEVWANYGSWSNCPEPPKAGAWYWSYVAGPFSSLKKAGEVAQARSLGEPFDSTEVVAAFDDGVSTQ